MTINIYEFQAVKVSPGGSWREGYKGCEGQLFNNFPVYSDTFVFCLSGRFERQASKREGTEPQKRPLWLTLVTWSLWGKIFESANFSSEIGSSHLTQTSLLFKD